MAKVLTYQDQLFIRDNPQMSNKELMDKFKCTREELSVAIKAVYRRENRNNRIWRSTINEQKK